MAIQSGHNYVKTQNFDILAHPVKNPDGEIFFFDAIFILLVLGYIHANFNKNR